MPSTSEPTNLISTTHKEHQLNTATAEQLELLRQWDTPALSNALDSLRIRPHNTGYTDGTISRIAGGTFAGIAVTARMVARDAGEDSVPVAELHAAVAAVGRQAVVVIEDCDQPDGAGAFLGEVNGTLLSALGVQAVVTNGRVRDVNELREMGFAVHAQGLCVARSYMRLVDVSTTVEVAGMSIRPGDIIHGDEHGVLEVPAHVIDSVLEKANVIREDEQDLVTWARSPEFTVEALLQLRRVRH
jgi:4-hydroxy-4-methyl-2-oxoglutarate aldolase